MADITREELLESIREKRKSFQHVNLSGLDLRGIDMQRLDFTGCSFIGARLAGNRMAEGLFSRADFREADLGHCNLASANLEHAVLVSANLVEADLTEARMSKANLRSANLTRAVAARADLSGADLTRAMLTNADFRGARMAGALFVGASMRGTLMRDVEASPALPLAAGAAPVPVPPPPALEPRPMPPVALSAPRSIPEAPVVPQRPAKAAPRRPEPAPAPAPEVQPQGLMARLMGRPAKEAAPVPPPKGYKPPSRQLPAQIYTEGGWITGQFSLPVMHGFLEYLNRKGELLKLQEVTHPLVQKELAFFGLRSEMAIMVVPKCEESLLNLSPITGQTEAHRISFFMDRRVIHGDLTIEAGVRISDYLNKGRWVILRDCKVESLGGSSPGQVVAFPLLLLNTTTVLGVSDEWGGWD